MNLFKSRVETADIWMKIQQPPFFTTKKFRVYIRFKEILLRPVFRLLDVLEPQKLWHMMQSLDQPNHVADRCSLWTSYMYCYPSLFSLRTTIAQIRREVPLRAMAMIEALYRLLIPSLLDCLDHVDRERRNIRVELRLTELLCRVSTHAKKLDIVDPTEASALLGHLESRYNYYSFRSMDSKHRKMIQHLPPDELDLIAYIDCIASKVQRLEHLLRRCWSWSARSTNLL